LGKNWGQSPIITNYHQKRGRPLLGSNTILFLLFGWILRVDGIESGLNKDSLIGCCSSIPSLS